MPNGGGIVESRFFEPLRGNKLVREIVAEEGKRLLVRVIGRFEKMRVRGIGIPLARSLSIFHRNCKTVFKKVLLVFSASKYFEAGLPRSYLSHYHCFISCRAGRNGPIGFSQPELTVQSSTKNYKATKFNWTSSKRKKNDCFG